MALTINDDGIYNSDTFTVSCSEAVIIGTAYAKICENTAIGTDEGCVPVFHAVLAGLLSEGSSIWNCGICTQAQLRYAVMKAGLSGGLFIENSGGNIKILPFSASGHFFTETQEENFIRSLENDISAGYKSGQMTDASALIQIYRSEIQNKFMKYPSRDRIRINSSNPLIKNFFCKLTGDGKTEHFDRITFSISSDGSRASAYSCESGFVFYEKLILICCINEFKKGNDIPLPHSFPSIADRLAKKFGRNILRYSPDSDEKTDTKRKELSLMYPFLNDGSFLTAQITEIMHEKNMSLSGLLSEIPEFTTAVKYLSMQNDPEQTIENIRKNSENNICYSCEDGRITAKKSKSGKSLILYSESYCTESAEEFCRNWLLSSGIH